MYSFLLSNTWCQIPFEKYIIFDIIKQNSSLTAVQSSYICCVINKIDNTRLYENTRHPSKRLRQDFLRFAFRYNDVVIIIIIL